jgi:DNA-binding MarR family transcriptional regulator
MLIIFDNRLERNFIMTIELIKQLLDACYLAKRAREMLPALPEGVTSSYIQCLDVIQKLQTRGIQPKISDLSDTLNLPRPGVTRTVKEMEKKGYLSKYASNEDGRITYIAITEKGEELSERYDKNYYSRLLKYMDDISDDEADCMISTIEKFYKVMSERRVEIE